MEKKEIISKLNLYADLMEFHGENPFKIKAFKNSVNIIRRLNSDITEEIKNKNIRNIKGIGKGISTFLENLIETDESPELTNLIDKTPDGIIELTSVRGLGIKKIKILYEELGIKSAKELEKACLANKIAQLKGFGLKTQENILKELKKLSERKNLFLLNQALEIAGEISAILTEFVSVLKIMPAGELRRIREVIGKISFVALLKDAEKFKKELREAEFVIIDENRKLKIITVQYQNISNIEIYYSSNADEFEKQLLICTGTDEFLKEIGGADNISSEKEYFVEHKHTFIIPEMRETEYFKLKVREKNSSIIEPEDLIGLIHFHTTYSDGGNSLEEMLTAAEKSGYRYAVVCDHSKSAYYANGLDENRILEQKELIEKLRERFKIKILQGIESDILRDGSLDYDKETLKTLDFVVASVHSIFGLSEKEMTDRIIKAVENPFTKILGHPTGRLLLRRDSYSLNISKIIDACAANNVAIEINSNPRRLDLDWRNIYEARNKGCLFAINADAHSIDDLSYVKYGVLIARKAGVTKEEVINAFDFEDFNKFIKGK